LLSNIIHVFYQSNYVYFISGFGGGQGQQIHPGMFLYYLSLYHNISKHLRLAKVQCIIKRQEIWVFIIIIIMFIIEDPTVAVKCRTAIKVIATIITISWPLQIFFSQMKIHIFFFNEYFVLSTNTDSTFTGHEYD